jgi:hypothetical protein
VPVHPYLCTGQRGGGAGAPASEDTAAYLGLIEQVVGLLNASRKILVEKRKRKEKKEIKEKRGKENRQVLYRKEKDTRG